MKNLVSGPLLNGRYMEWTHGDCNYYSILQQLMSGCLGQILYEKWRNNSEQMEDSAHLMIQDSHGIHAQVEVKPICWVQHKGFSRKIWLHTVFIYSTPGTSLSVRAELFYFIFSFFFFFFCAVLKVFVAASELSLVVVSRGCSLVAVPRLLIVVASIVGEHRL